MTDYFIITDARSEITVTFHDDEVNISSPLGDDITIKRKDVPILIGVLCDGLFRVSEVLEVTSNVST